MVTLELVGRLALVLPKSYEITCLPQKDSLSIVWMMFHSSLCHPVIHNRAVVLRLLPVRKTMGYLACLKVEWTWEIYICDQSDFLVIIIVACISLPAVFRLFSLFTLKEKLPGSLTPATQQTQGPSVPPPQPGGGV